jgi:5'-nucleotidase
MNVLLTNDDGIHYPGLWALYRSLRERFTVEVIAPDRERSAVGHAITLHEPLRASRTIVNGGYEGYAVTGTPADCVKLGVLELLEQKPDVVVSGINPGANVGINLNYSGTVAAAKEAAFYGIAAVAVSVDGTHTENFDAAAGFVRSLVEKIVAEGLPNGTFLNVNIPDAALDRIAGVRISRQGAPLSGDYFERRLDPRNRVYYWQGCDTQTFAEDDALDGAALKRSYISITPVKVDMTDYETLRKMESWRFEL